MSDGDGSSHGYGSGIVGSSLNSESRAFIKHGNGQIPGIFRCFIETKNLHFFWGGSIAMFCLNVCPYRLPSGQDWKKTLVLVTGRFLPERAGLRRVYSKDCTFIRRCEFWLIRSAHSRCPVSTILMVSAGCGHTALLRGDGVAVAFGRSRSGQCNVPRLKEGITLSRFLQAIFTQYFSEAMAMLLLAEWTIMDNVKFHL